MNLNMRGSQLAVALLDDPIQNMDDFNVLGLLDLLRGLVPDRQFVVSTHDEQIGELIRRKLRPGTVGAQTVTHFFEGYERQRLSAEAFARRFIEAWRARAARARAMPPAASSRSIRSASHRGPGGRRGERRRTAPSRAKRTRQLKKTPPSPHTRSTAPAPAKRCAASSCK